MMTKHDYAQAIFLALLAGFTGLTLWAAFTTTVQCSAIGGTTVRGLVWLECIK